MKKCFACNKEKDTPLIHPDVIVKSDDLTSNRMCEDCGRGMLPEGLDELNRLLKVAKGEIPFDNKSDIDFFVGANQHWAIREIEAKIEKLKKQ